MQATKTVAATLLVFGTLFASPVQADRIGNRAWRWTSWNAKTGVQAVVPKVPVAPTPVEAPPVPTPEPIIVPPADDWRNSSRFAASPNPASTFIPQPPSIQPQPPVQAQAPIQASAPIQSFTYTPPTAPQPSSSTQSKADAYINLSGSPYPDAQLMVSGDPQPWYTSPVVAKLYGGTPNEQQRNEFASEVLSDVKGVFERSGLHNVELTTDPNVGGIHTMSVVSGVSYASNDKVIGITNVGQSGLTFIDKFGQAESVDQLATIVANNVSHELMHAFGVPDHPDETGEHVDAASATWAALTDPNATLSPEAVEAILSHQPWNGLNAFGSVNGAAQFAHEELAPTPVPEPTTIVLWSVVGIVGAAIHHRSRAAKKSA